MRVHSEEIVIPKERMSFGSLEKLKEYFDVEIRKEFPESIPLRFVITKNASKGSFCDVDFVTYEQQSEKALYPIANIFDFRKRAHDETDQFNVVLLIPTGVGAEIGGSCGDGNVVARLMASACDTLITHPNVVNASDINEMTENTLYVEGSILTRFMMGTGGLQRVRSNRIMMIMDKSHDGLFNNEIVNAVSSARVTLGIDCDVIELKESIRSSSLFTKSGRAAGHVERIDRLFDVVRKFREQYDAVGLATVIKVPDRLDKDYFRKDEEVVNPWGGIEAMITHSTASVSDLPCAHSPLNDTRENLHLNMKLGIVDPRKAPESASVTYLHCILKGLHRSPRIVAWENGISVENVSCLVIPDGCVGLPVLSCIEQGIPVIAVKNKNAMKNDLRALPFKRRQLYFAENYLEAAGIVAAIKAGIEINTLKRPIADTSSLRNR